MFCVYVASMCGPSKANVELVFEGPPSIAQVMSRAAVALERLASLRGVRGFEFAVSFAMCFDDFESHWVPLERSTQLVHNCQLYIFLPDVVDLPGEIPDPVSANQFLGDYSSPERGVSPAAASVPPSSSPRAEMPSTFTPRRNFSYPSVEDIRRYSAERHREAAKLPDIPGASIIAQEREAEARKAGLDVDVHRETVRRETQSFLEGGWSPSRSPRR
jgi:hypothetical protein